MTLAGPSRTIIVEPLDARRSTDPCKAESLAHDDARERQAPDIERRPQDEHSAASSAVR